MGSRNAADPAWLRAVGLGLLVLSFAACGAEGDGDPPPGPTVYKDYALVVAAGSDQFLSFAIDRETGGLSAAGSALFPDGADPRSIALGPGDKFAYVVVYSWRYPCVFKVLVDPASGAPTIANERFCLADQPLRVVSDPARKCIYVTTGSADRIYGLYANPGTGSLTALPASPFAAPGGPVDIAFEPGGRFAYILNYNAESVSLYTVDAATGALIEQPGATAGVGDDPHDIAIDPSGKFLYVANTTSDNISAFKIDGATGALTEVPGSPFNDPGYHVAFPTAIGIDPSGQHLYVVNGTACVSEFRIDDVWGTLTLFATPATYWDSPQAIAFESSGKFAFMVYFRPTAYITAHTFDSYGSLLREGMLEAGSYAHDVVVARIAQ
jgi:6-phosphogluconolactonase